MTKKDFELIAAALKDTRATERTVNMMASSLSTTNSRFNVQRFIDAATAEPLRQSPDNQAALAALRREVK